MKQRTVKVLTTPYAAIGAAGVCMAIAALLFRIQAYLVPQDIEFLWQSMTGTALLGVICYQWMLFRKRWIRKMRRSDLTAHRWAGVAAVILFGLHAARLGHTWMTAITIIFIMIGITGVLNAEVMRYRTRWAYLTWLSLHIGLSAAILPLIAVHIWVALAY